MNVEFKSMAMNVLFFDKKVFGAFRVYLCPYQSTIPTQKYLVWKNCRVGDLNLVEILKKGETIGSSFS